MNRIRIVLAAGLAAMTLAPLAQLAANDSIAETAAGGLVLKQTDEIDMVSEDLYVSAAQVRVRYAFRNRTARDVRATVAFPMPDRNLAELRDSNEAFPSDFATRVDGRPVEMRVERRALLGGVDHSALLERLGVPVVIGESPVAFVGRALDGLPEADRRRLAELGLAEWTEWDEGRGMERHLQPLWTVKETWHWQQLFPAGRDLVVEHQYTPGTGMSMGSAIATREGRASPEGRRAIEEFCVDSQFLAALDRLARRASTPEFPLLDEQRVRYVLSTGANWRSPIGDFRLVVDKGAPDAIVSFCGSGLRRIGPTQFEMRRRNWRPTADLNVLIIHPEPRR
jgi:hypothetical protein